MAKVSVQDMLRVRVMVWVRVGVQVRVREWFRECVRVGNGWFGNG